MTNLPTVNEMQNWKKRYKLDDSGKAVIDSNDGGEYWTIHKNEAYNLCIDMNKLYEENKELRSDRDYWKTLAQSLAKNNGNVELKDEHLAWKRVDVE